VQHPALDIDLGQLKAARLRNSQAVPKHQEHQATVAGCVPAALGRCNEPVYLDGDKVFSFSHRLVQCIGDRCGT